MKNPSIFWIESRAKFLFRCCASTSDEMAPWESKQVFANPVSESHLAHAAFGTVNHKNNGYCPDAAVSHAAAASTDSETVSSQIPAWERTRTDMARGFPSFYADPEDNFRSTIDTTLRRMESLRQQTPAGPVHYGQNTPFWTHEEGRDSATLPAERSDLNAVLADVVGLFDGVNNVAHPLFQYNVICHPNKAAIAAGLVANYASPNYISGHSGWNSTRAEVECGEMIADLVEGWENTKPGGVFTFGGSGCYLYALKYALTDVFRKFDTRRKGLSGVTGRVFTSRHGHFCNTITTDWLGLGTDCVTLINTQHRTNAMCMVDLEQHLKASHEAGEPVILVVCTMGTTDSMAIDPVDKVSALLDKYPNPAGYGRAHIYCDSVAGWAFLSFRHYDFDSNPLQFSPAVLDKLRENLEKMSAVRYANSMSLDFHKTGWSPYTTSMFLARDFDHFSTSLSRVVNHIVHNRTTYNPGNYTLEVSRSAAPAVGAWATLRFFGARGFQTMMGGIVELGFHLRNLISQESSLVCCNELGNGLLTAIRVYPSHIDAKAQWKTELTVDRDDVRADIQKYNCLQKEVADRVWLYVTEGKLVNGKHPICFNYSAAFCNTEYRREDGSPGASFFTLKSFPMNVNVTKQHMNDLVECIKFIRDDVLSES